MSRNPACAAPKPVEIGDAAAAVLVAAARSLPISGWDFPAWPDALPERLPDSPDVAAFVREIRSNLAADGFCVARLAKIVDGQPENIAAGAVTLWATAFGAPLRIYANNPSHWRSLGADPQRPSNRSEGVGLQLPHTDFCNAEYPPDFVCLLCLRPDPLGGGASLVVRMDDLEETLDEADVAALSRPVFRDGQVVNLSGVGQDANPFAIISPGARFRYRFVGHLLESAPKPAEQAAVGALVRAMTAKMHTILLAAGDLLIVDQHVAVHGRAALGPQQENLPVALRRNLLLSFLRTAPVS